MIVAILQGQDMFQVLHPEYPHDRRDSRRRNRDNRGMSQLSTVRAATACFVISYRHNANQMGLA